jgi:hypothetical protein
MLGAASLLSVVEMLVSACAPSLAGGGATGEGEQAVAASRAVAARVMRIEISPERAQQPPGLLPVFSAE